MFSRFPNTRIVITKLISAGICLKMRFWRAAIWKCFIQCENQRRVLTKRMPAAFHAKIVVSMMAGWTRRRTAVTPTASLRSSLPRTWPSPGMIRGRVAWWCSFWTSTWIRWRPGVCRSLFVLLTNQVIRDLSKWPMERRTDGHVQVPKKLGETGLTIQFTKIWPQM